MWWALSHLRQWTRGENSSSVQRHRQQNAWVKMARIFENDGSAPLGPDDIDGMEELLDELDAGGTTWDILTENPPREGYTR